MQNPSSNTRSAALITAFVCGALPLVLGTAVFLIWFATRWLWWERAWAWLIGLASVCMLIGAVAVARHVRQSRQAGRPGAWKLSAGAAFLLLLNIPVGAAYLMIVGSLLTRFTLEVVNLSNAPVESLVLNGPGIENLEIGPVGPQQRASKPLHFTHDGKLAYSGRHHGTVHTGILESSASPISGGGKRLQITPEGQWEVGPR